tara:strand:+ start:2295 stop:3206 length:912 start_codon:yes stop_codon:yes gene_type:complete
MSNITNNVGKKEFNAVKEKRKERSDLVIKKQAVSFLIFTDSIRQAKTGKNRSIDGLKHYWVISLELTPSVRTCPYAFAKKLECTNNGFGCLNTSGHGMVPNVKNKRNWRTDQVLDNWSMALDMIKADLAVAHAVASARGDTLAVRLDTFSSLHLWNRDEFYNEVIKPYQDKGVIFYDYIKAPLARIKEGINRGIDLTVSFTEYTTPKKLGEYLEIARVAVVFDGEIPDYWNGHKVINGDNHDLRFTEPSGSIIGLTSKIIAKGRKHADHSKGFVQIGATKIQRQSSSALIPAMAPSVDAVLYV